MQCGERRSKWLWIYDLKPIGSGPFCSSKIKIGETSVNDDPRDIKKNVGFGPCPNDSVELFTEHKLRWMAIQPWCHYFHVHGVSNLPARKLHLSVRLYVLSVYVILYYMYLCEHIWKHKYVYIYIHVCCLSYSIRSPNRFPYFIAFPTVPPNAAKGAAAKGSFWRSLLSKPSFFRALSGRNSGWRVTILQTMLILLTINKILLFLMRWYDFQAKITQRNLHVLTIINIILYTLPILDTLLFFGWLVDIPMNTKRLKD